jgi:hypothetical protein
MSKPRRGEREVTKQSLTGQFAEKFVLVHPVLEGFPPVDKNYRNFVIELPSKFGIGVNINLTPGESAAAG